MMEMKIRTDTKSDIETVRKSDTDKNGNEAISRYKDSGGFWDNDEDRGGCRNRTGDKNGNLDSNRGGCRSKNSNTERSRVNSEDGGGKVCTDPLRDCNGDEG